MVALVSNSPSAKASKGESPRPNYSRAVRDAQIEADSKSGALDTLLREVDDDIARGEVRPLDDLSR